LGAAQLPERQLRVRAAGGSATQEGLQQVPAPVDVVARRLIPGKLSARPVPPRGPRRGGPPKNGPWLGSPKTFARKRCGWQPPPSAAGAVGQAGDGLGQAVLPGRRLRVVVVRRLAPTRASKPGHRQPPPPSEAVFPTELTLRLEASLAQ
jgi:hypothetical protein